LSTLDLNEFGGFSVSSLAGGLNHANSTISRVLKNPETLTGSKV
jgi:hypothetical protein